ncbi:MAG: DUF488 domain-containing protein [Bacteroidia bacterium]|nr:DUF488 domain-containing protein [Bacteroidia bacterium]
MKYLLKTKRIYEAPERSDGYRILVDRLWPRGISKEKAAVDEWNKIIAPSPELRKFFSHKTDLFDTFKKLYIEELKTQKEELTRIKTLTANQNITLLFGAKDEQHNQAVVLLEVLTKTKIQL